MKRATNHISDSRPGFDGAQGHCVRNCFYILMPWTIPSVLATPTNSSTTMCNCKCSGAGVTCESCCRTSQLFTKRTGKQVFRVENLMGLQLKVLAAFIHKYGHNTMSKQCNQIQKV